MATMMMHPPSSGTTSTTVNGRTYKGTAGTPIPVPDFDAAMLEANGWINTGYAGTTAQRPTAPALGAKFQDTTVGAQIVWDGKTWRHATTGASV